MKRHGLEELLAALPVGKPVIVALDFDGTLVPITRHHSKPAVSPALRRTLERLAKAPGMRLMLASGRGLADLESRVGVRGAAYIANHGLEAKEGSWHWKHPAALASMPTIQKVARALAEPVERTAGASLEDKGLSLSLHYRGVRSAAAVRKLERIVEDCLRSSRRPIRILHGKKVWNIKPDVGWDKGKGLLLWKRRRKVDGALIFAGDDRTDEEGFRSLGSRALCVKVGPGATSARYRLRQKDIRAMLEELLRSRNAGR